MKHFGTKQNRSSFSHWLTISWCFTYHACDLVPKKEIAASSPEYVSYLQPSELKCSFSVHFPPQATRLKTLWPRVEAIAGIDTGEHTSKLTITTFLTLMAFLMWLKTEISSWFLFPVPAILMEAIGFESSECYSWVHWGFPKKQGLFGRRRERGFYKLCIVRQDQAASPFGWSKQETALIVGVGRGEGSKWRTTGSLLWFM